METANYFASQYYFCNAQFPAKKR
ncbi:protein of unknown function (plasmid) [Shinella sp. WSC3-e]|nr:protein of unknown function [Shinella sp. WSC3-e]